MARWGGVFFIATFYVPTLIIAVGAAAYWRGTRSWPASGFAASAIAAFVFSVGRQLYNVGLAPVSPMSMERAARMNLTLSYISLALDLSMAICLVLVLRSAMNTRPAACTTDDAGAAEPSPV